MSAEDIFEKILGQWVFGVIVAAMLLEYGMARLTGRDTSIKNFWPWVAIIMAIHFITNTYR